MLVFLVAVTKYRTKATSGKLGLEFEPVVHHGGEAVEAREALAVATGM